MKKNETNLLNKKVSNQWRARTSKYVGQVFDGWLVASIGVASITAGNRKTAGHRNYFYLLERITSDGKCIKQVRLSGKQLTKLSYGAFDIEAYADKHAHNKQATKKTNYAFI